MREIKFRFYVLNTEKEVVDKQEYTLDNILSEDKAVLPKGYSYIAVESTERKDKNGDVIYEGDIVKLITSNPYWKEPRVKVGEVIYENSAFKTKSFQLDNISIGKAIENTYEIVGNIHENKELLNDKD